MGIPLSARHRTSVGGHHNQRAQAGVPSVRARITSSRMPLERLSHPRSLSTRRAVLPLSGLARRPGSLQDGVNSRPFSGRRACRSVRQASSTSLVKSAKGGLRPANRGTATRFGRMQLRKRQSRRAQQTVAFLSAHPSGDIYEKYQVQRRRVEVEELDVAGGAVCRRRGSRPPSDPERDCAWMPRVPPLPRDQRNTRLESRRF